MKIFNMIFNMKGSVFGICFLKMSLGWFGMCFQLDLLSEEHTFLDHEAMPFFSKYCSDCHGFEKQKAGLNLESFADKIPIYEKREVWELVRELLEKREMPPEKKPQPTENERMKIIQFINEGLAEFDCDEIRQPGKVTLRRLNRTEYGNTIRDLMGIDFEPARDFPLDEVGYGFDNIGDVLSLSPLLMEKYLVAARQIVSQSIIFSLDKRMSKWRFEAEDFRSGNEDHVRGEDQVMGFYREGTATHFFKIDEDGTYRLTIRAYGHQAGNEAARLSVRINQQKAVMIEVPDYEDHPGLYTIEMPLSSGSHRLELGYVNNFNEAGDRNLFVDYVILEGPLEKANAPLPETHLRIFTEVPKQGSELESAKKIMSQFASRAFRRPTNDAEINGLLKIISEVLKAEASFEEAIGIAIQAVLVSPSFLYRWELDDRKDQKDQDDQDDQHDEKVENDRKVEKAHNDHNEIRDLSDYEFASRLSYFLWSSMPDEELFDLAKKGTLMMPEMIREQVKRMLLDPKAEALAMNFGGQWLQFRNLDSVSPDPDLFPDFDDALREAMQNESVLFFTAMMRENRSLFEFLDADFTFVNDRLAAHYELEGSFSKEFERVSLSPKSPRGGILTQASTLSLTANPTRTSPVIRGKWVLEQILGTPPPPPPPEVEELEESEKVASSLRERLEVHRSNSECATCHSKMDPIGFAFEHFDAIGAWRDLDGNFPVDASGKLPDGSTFDDHKGLITIIKNDEKFIRTIVEKMLTFALGRGLEYFDKCAVDDIIAFLSASDYRFVELVNAIVTSPPFQKINRQ